MRKFLYFLSILFLVATLVVTSLFVYPLVEPLIDIPVIGIIYNLALYVSSLAVFASIYLIPQIIFLVCLAIMIALFVYAYKSGALRRKDVIALTIINGVSFCLVLGFTLGLYLMCKGM